MTELPAVPGLPTDDAEALDRLEELDEITFDSAEIADAFDRLLTWRGRHQRDLDDITTRAEQHRADLRAVIADELADVEAWEEDRTIGPARQISRINEQIARLAQWWRNTHRNDDRAAKSWNLPHGTVRTRDVPASIKVDDPDAFLRWALPGVMRALDEAPPEVRACVNLSVAVSAVKQLCTIDGTRVVRTATGEVVPGLRVEPGHLSITY